MKKKSVLIKRIVYNVVDKRKREPIIRRVDLRRTPRQLRFDESNQIAKRILNLLPPVAKKNYTSFSEAITDLFKKHIIDEDAFDEILFKYWLQHDNSLFLLEELIKCLPISPSFSFASSFPTPSPKEKIKQFIFSLNEEYIKKIILNDKKFVLTSPKHLEQELGITFDLNEDVFFVRFVNDVRFFNDEVKSYIKRRSKLATYVMNDLKNNINVYMNNLYKTHMLEHI